jgi:hypothetical protein
MAKNFIASSPSKNFNRPPAESNPDKILLSLYKIHREVIVSDIIGQCASTDLCQSGRTTTDCGIWGSMELDVILFLLHIHIIFSGS